MDCRIEKDRELAREINQLKTKIAELQRERAKLRHNVISVGDAELYADNDSTYYPGKKYTVKVLGNCYPIMTDKKHRQTIITRTNRKETISRLEEIIQDLQGLLLAMKTKMDW